MNSTPGRLPTAIVVALVLLRLAVGWHFYREGTKKLVRDPVTHEIRIDVPTDAFLKQAVGPLGPFFRSLAPNFHQWEKLLAEPASPDANAKDPSPGNPSGRWQERILADWRKTLADFASVPGITAEQQKAGADAFEKRQLQLNDYLDSQTDAIADWQHQLARLAEWEASPEATVVPFMIKRIAEKRAETNATATGWVDQVRAIQNGLTSDLRALLTPEQDKDAATVASVDAALTAPGERRLEQMNLAIASVVTGVGVLLLLGFFTRLASVAGILFILSVIATQPPWVPGAVTIMFYYQLVEIAALVALLLTGAGRWAGLDYFFDVYKRKRADAAPA